MRLIDTILGRTENPDTLVRNQTLPLRDVYPNDKEIITVDPNEPLPGPSSRPPIIFENG